ncbi:sensor histidine kinase [Sphingobacterium sp. ML3W]|uniref:sensor histidine kinase n=1 Tax=Sphingobacterium sp. ML3W TaxID=1538644 RepID=UPI0009DC9C7A|nr:histidine kinase [Sphingobacterium sp. ML3W]
MQQSLFSLKRNRFLIFGLAIICTLVVYLLMFRVIDQRLEEFNTRFLKEISLEKAQLVQKEFDDFERTFQLMGIAADENQQGFINKLIEQGDVSQFILSYSFWKSSGAYFSKEFEWYENPNVSVPTQVASEISNGFKSVRFIQVQSDKYLEVFIKTRTGILQLILDLNRLNTYVANQKIGMRAYFELYDQDGICLMHPDLARVGEKKKKNFVSYPVKDSTILSEYLILDVIVNEYKLKGIFSENKFFVNVLLLTTQDDVHSISRVSFFLGAIGIGIMLFCMFLMDLQNRKAKRLSLRNLEYQKEDALLRFENLKRKVDPHFLFNALGSLQQLIGKDPVQAKVFVGKMAKVYRKFLSGDDSGLATIREEVVLAEEYFFLQKIRFVDTLNPLEISISQEALALSIPRFSLQILIENAIKHNELSKMQPLTIVITEMGGRIAVKNSVLLKKSDMDSAGYGTHMIAHVYDFYHVQGFEIQQTETHFTVYLPPIPIDSQ